MSHDEISSGINRQENGINRLLEEAAAELRIPDDIRSPFPVISVHFDDGFMAQS